MMNAIKTPELQQSHLFLQTPPTFESIQARKKSRKLILTSLTCFICDDPLTFHLAGEMKIELTCGHYCHLACFDLILPEDAELHPICTICECETRCIVESVHEKLWTNKLCNLSPSLEYLPSQALEYTDLQIGLQSLSPPTSLISNIHKSSINELTKPRIEFEYCSTESKQDRFNIRIQSPEVYSKEEKLQKKWLFHDIAIKEDIMDMLNNFGISREVDELIIFDFISLTLNGKNFGITQALLFTNGLLLIQDKKEVCFIKTSEFSSIEQASQTQFVLNTTCERIPEIIFNSSDGSSEEWEIPVKWMHYINKLIKNEYISSCRSITSNAWELVCEELQRSTEAYDNSFVPLDVKSANIIFCVSVINTTEHQLSNSMYKSNLQATLRKLIRRLKPCDKLGLVFIGVGSCGKPGNQASLMGFSGPNWEGWNVIIDEIEIFSNNVHGKRLFTNCEDVLLALRKAKNLLPFMEMENRVNLLNILKFDSTNEVENEVFKLIGDLGTDLAVSIVGPETSAIASMSKHHFDKPIQDKHHKGRWIKVPITIVDMDLITHIDGDYISSIFKYIYIPKLTISIDIDDFELNGYETEDNVTSLDIIVHNIDSQFQESFNLATAANKVLKYESKWLGKCYPHYINRLA